MAIKRIAMNLFLHPEDEKIAKEGRIGVNLKGEI